MSLTAATHKRFWRAMGERFGKRWIDEYGETPTKAWADMLDHYTPDDVHNALRAMSTKSWAHPPTLPQFEPLLVEAARRTKAMEIDFCRGYWRSEIVAHVARGIAVRGFIASHAEFEDYLIQHKHTLGVSLRNLLNDVDSMEKSTGQRTDGMHVMVAQRCQQIATMFTPRAQLEVAS